MVHREQFRREDPLACLAEGLRRLIAQPFQSPMQHLTLAESVAETHDIGLLSGVGVPQILGIADPVEVRHDPPAPAQPFADPLHRIHHGVPQQRSITAHGLFQRLFQGAELIVERSEQSRKVAAHHRRIDGAVLRKTLSAEQRGDGRCHVSRGGDG